MLFINRKPELEFLEKKYHSSAAELLVIYGRRRIGKTQLLLQFCKNKKQLYFMGRLESREDTLRRFNHLLIETFDDKKLLNYPLSDWDLIFEYLAEKAAENIVVVFDEFPFLVDRFPEIVSVLQDKWDNLLVKSKIKIILCGSSVSMMEKYALNLKSPLYGRRTGQWKIDKMEVIHLRDFFPGYTLEEIITLYSCLDTIPGYLVKFNPEKTVFENIREKIFSKGEFLYEEIEILLFEEFRDPSNYMSILSAIAGGLSTFHEIWNRTGLDKSLLSKYLHVLEKVGILEKTIPLTETYKAKLKSKGALYSLKDNFFDFWFRFVYGNKQELEKGQAEETLKILRPEMNTYLGRVFEKFVLELLPRLPLGHFNRSGKWWHKDQEIDVVAINDQENEILWGECKWREKVEARPLLKALQEKSKLVPWKNDKRKEKYVIFAKSFSSKISTFEGKKVYCFDLKDLEKILKSDTK